MRFLALTALAALTLTACGGGGDDRLWLADLAPLSQQTGWIELQNDSSRTWDYVELHRETSGSPIEYGVWFSPSLVPGASWKSDALEPGEYMIHLSSLDIHGPATYRISVRAGITSPVVIAD